MTREYRCARCGGVYAKTWPDEAAEIEKTALFGPIPLSACDVVCDDCFRRIMGDPDREDLPM